MLAQHFVGKSVDFWFARSGSNADIKLENVILYVIFYNSKQKRVALSGTL